jgi:hypothetical protein
MFVLPYIRNKLSQTPIYGKRKVKSFGVNKSLIQIIQSEYINVP